MSYSIALSVTDGTVAVASVNGTVPDGSISVSGHDDGDYSTLSVTVNRKAAS